LHCQPFTVPKKRSLRAVRKLGYAASECVVCILFKDRGTVAMRTGTDQLMKRIPLESDAAVIEAAVDHSAKRVVTCSKAAKAADHVVRHALAGECNGVQRPVPME